MAEIISRGHSRPMEPTREETTEMATAVSRSKLGNGAQRLRQIISRCSGIDPQRGRLAEQALSRIKEGTYGYCMRCGMQIPEREMESIPERRYCYHCQKKKAA